MTTDNVVPITQERARTLMLGMARKLVVPTYSAPPVGAQISRLFSQYAPLGYQLPWHVLDYIELLATYNSDYSQAVENIRTLANSGHTLHVLAQGKRATTRLKDRLEEKARTLQESHGGIDGIIDKLLDQAATYGAMCGEWVVDEKLSDVVQFVDVNPKHIRFFWEDDEQQWAPYQKVTGHQAQEARDRGQKVIENCVKLDQNTFRYYAFDAEPGSPYGTPPFLAALAPIAIQRDMVDNLAQVVKKLGLLAVIDMTVKSMPALPNETEDQYRARAGAYLDEYIGVVQDMAKDGGIVHYDDVEMKVTGLSGNAAGATNIFKQNEEQVFSGLKSMPSVQGRSYSTTETYAGVAYDIIIRNTAKYQRAVKRMIEAGYWLMATLWSEPAQSIRIEFKENKTLMRLQNAQSDRLEIDNIYRKIRAGWITPTQGAQEAGYNTVAVEYENEDMPFIYDDKDKTSQDIDDSTQDPGADERRDDELHNR